MKGLDRAPRQFIGPCPVCGSVDFAEFSVLWSDLKETWQLTIDEAHYINRQQGFHCKQCHNNLRSMGLAAAILREYCHNGTLAQFCESPNELRILEINTAGNLTKILKKLPGHALVEYPEFDMMNLNIESDRYDLVIHSDTLEHVTLPEQALSECLRVLCLGGKCIFTIPIIVDRFTRNRTGLIPSYHGQQGISAHDQLVYSEFGADFWKFVLRAGFASCEIFGYEYPSALILIAKKN